MDRWRDGEERLTLTMKATRLVVLRLNEGIQAKLFYKSTSSSFVATKVLRWADDKPVLHFGYRLNDAQFKITAECIAYSIWKQPPKPYWDEDYIKYVVECDSQEEAGDSDV